MAFRVTLNTNIPTKFEIVPNGTTTTNPNEVIVVNNLMPEDFAMNFNTYTYTTGIFVRNATPINNRVLNAHTPGFLEAAVVAANTPAT